ncbi:MAG: T9SS type A sorting domain-containing protein [candidate division KSB1 bacterium]|nr:T9SS type A sorting domain-containing protein [candidate division KSB1 bacterium]
MEPFYFEKPLNIILPYKQDLLNELGIRAEELGLFFFTGTGSYTDAGIQNVVVDTVANRIYAQVVHFSTLVVRKQQMQTAAHESVMSGLPQQYRLEQNYPNPFNPSTRIQFSLKQSADVTIRVYDILGREISTLVSRKFQAGQYTAEWNGMNNTGKMTASGVYIYTLSIDGKTVAARRMLLLK